LIDPVRELKVRAEVLHHAVQASEVAALERLRVLAELRRADGDALRAAAPAIQRKHCLLTVSRELGFASWEHARRVFEGDASELDFGTLLYAEFGAGHLNHWFASYEDARDFHAGTSNVEACRYLLAYARQFFVVEREFIRLLGVDADDADWQAIGRDWPRPRSPDARRRLYGKILAAQRSRCVARAPSRAST
jgi:hypothetical protein